MSTQHNSNSDATDTPAGALPTAVIVDVKRSLATLLTPPPDDADDHTARVLTARSVTNAMGQCPECGARVVVPNRAQRRKARLAGVVVTRVRVRHGEDCPAGDTTVPEANDYLVAQLARLARSRR